MPLDAYSLCPGGTGKRIKFCCKDQLSDLQQIDRMLEGQQHYACLQYIEQLEKTTPDRACLLATKALLLRVLDQPDQLRDTVTAFVRAHPDNPLALAEWAMLAAEDEGGRRGLEILQQAIARCEGHLPGRVYSALGLVAHALLDEVGNHECPALVLRRQSGKSQEVAQSYGTACDRQNHADPRAPGLMLDGLVGHRRLSEW